MNNKQTSLFHSTILQGSDSDRSLQHIITLVEMTHDFYSKDGEPPSIKYEFLESDFGTILIASTTIGICHLAFIDDRDDGFSALSTQFPNALFAQEKLDSHQNALLTFHGDCDNLSPIHLHVKGTPFQIKVWHTLLSIPFGRLTNYGAIAKELEMPKAARAVGTAIGKNPIAYLIPCHRVIQASGKLGGFKWGMKRKVKILKWEAGNL